MASYYFIVQVYKASTCSQKDTTTRYRIYSGFTTPPINIPFAIYRLAVHHVYPHYPVIQGEGAGLKGSNQSCTYHGVCRSVHLQYPQRETESYLILPGHCIDRRLIDTIRNFVRRSGVSSQGRAAFTARRKGYRRKPGSASSSFCLNEVS